MSDFVKVQIMAVLQGLTEFLPVSSSGHLVLAKHFLRLDSPGVVTEVALHIGTLLSVLVFYRRRIFSLLGNLAKGEADAKRYVLAIVIGTIPAGIVGVAFKSRFEALGDSPRLCAALLVVTGAILLSLLFKRKAQKELGLIEALCIGLAQALAITPGISRSGSTIVTARHLGIASENAAEYSFFLMLPAVAGASMLELRHGLPEAGAVSPLSLLFGILTAAIVGYIAIALLLKVLRSDKFWLFGPYCIAAGALGMYLL